jgi:hypothetical protein
VCDEWRYAVAAQEIERLRISYLMHRSEDGWKIAMIVLAACLKTGQRAASFEAF